MTEQLENVEPNFNFTGKTALITGAAQGVGAAIAEIIHKGGGYVAVSDIDEAGAINLAERLDPTSNSSVGIKLDVREKDDFLAASNQVVEKWGKVDIVVNNAGYAKRTPVNDISADEFDSIVAINMRSVFFSCQHFAEHMKKNGYGRIINITSLAGQNGGTVASAHYSASKAGAIMLSKYFARYLAGTGVTVNAIAPGPISTAKQRLSSEQISAVEAQVPVGRFMETSEIAATAALLASEQGGFFMGATLDMNGGLYLR